MFTYVFKKLKYVRRSIVHFSIKLETRLCKVKNRDKPFIKGLFGSRVGPVEVSAS